METIPYQPVCSKEYYDEVMEYTTKNHRAVALAMKDGKEGLLDGNAAALIRIPNIVERIKYAANMLGNLQTIVYKSEHSVRSYETMFSTEDPIFYKGKHSTIMTKDVCNMPYHKFFLRKRTVKILKRLADSLEGLKVTSVFFDNFAHSDLLIMHNHSIGNAIELELEDQSDPEASRRDYAADRLMVRKVINGVGDDKSIGCKVIATGKVLTIIGESNSPYAVRYANTTSPQMLRGIPVKEWGTR